MAKSTTYIMGMFLFVLLLAAAQVQADAVTFKFQAADSMTQGYYQGDIPSNHFYLTATKKDGGVEFDFSSDWRTGKESTITIKPTEPFKPTNPLYFYGVSDVFKFDNVGKGQTGMDLFKGFNDRPDGVGYVTNKVFVQEEGEDYMAVKTISLSFLEGMGWEDFLASLKDENDMFAFSAYIGNLDGNGRNGKFITTGTLGTPSTPEPATLALMGLGLAGLGMVSRRKRK